MQIVLVFLGVIGALFGAYLGFVSVAGLLLRRKDYPAAARQRRIAAVIAARNEEAVIAPLIESLLKQKYPRELFEVFVIPNNCTDNTEAAARRAGAQIIPCAGKISSKGDALRCAFAYLAALDQPFDAYCIFDADNLVHEDFFAAVNDAREAGVRVAQGYRDSKNPCDNWISGSMAAFYWFMSRFYNASRAALGMSAALNGTGFMVADDLIREMGWETVTLTEDLEFTALCSLRGIKIGWMPRARIYDEQPVTMRDSVLQRRRWSAGSLQCLKRYGASLFSRGSINAFDIGMIFLGMTMNLVGLLSAFCTVFLFIRQWLLSPGSLPLMLLMVLIGALGSSLSMSLFCLIMFALEKKLTPRAVPAILLFSLFMLTWFPINVACFFTRPPKWDPIRHTANHAVPM